jgi:hypothetical protein
LAQFEKKEKKVHAKAQRRKGLEWRLTFFAFFASLRLCVRFLLVGGSLLKFNLNHHRRAARAP